MFARRLFESPNSRQAVAVNCKDNIDHDYSQMEALPFPSENHDLER
jgi:hypothetical protein